MNFQGYVTVQLSRFLVCCCSAATSLVYHALFCLSRTFLTFFKSFLMFFFQTYSASIDFIIDFRYCQELFYFFEFFILFKRFKKIRRRRDLNPRTARTVYTLSRGASSATWVLLQIQMHSVLNSVHQWRIWNYTLWIYFCQCFF